MADNDVERQWDVDSQTWRYEEPHWNKQNVGKTQEFFWIVGEDIRIWIVVSAYHDIKN